MLNHILSASQFNRDRLEIIFQRAKLLEAIYEANPKECLQLIGTRTIRGALLFFEPSTRTHMSFKKAFDRLGIMINYDTISAAISSSAAKGESIENSLLNMYEIDSPDTIHLVVLRHPHDDAAERAAAVASQYDSIILNAGAGKKEHPTQMLLDLYTIYQKRDGQIDEVKIVVGGDPLASRTIHSLVIGLTQNYKIPEIGVCGPAGSSLPENVLSQIPNDCRIINFPNYEQALGWKPDFVYCTRPQLERYIPIGISDEKKEIEIRKLVEQFKFLQINHALAQKMQEIDCWFMHPQPVDSVHFNEILPELVKHKQSLLLKQSRNGVWTRMAAITDVLNIQL